MMDIKRRVSSRVPVKGGAIAYGIEGSKVVLAALERTKSEDDVAFLKPVADNATAILCTMREIREGDVDDEFAGLALDACGLAFVLLHECHRFHRDHDRIPDKLKWSSDELAEYLREDVHPFVQKKISRGFLKRHLMHATDEEKIMKVREKLRGWMGKFGIQTEFSIHEKVEEIISEKVSTRNEEARIVNSPALDLSQANLPGTQILPSKPDQLRPLGEAELSGKPLPQIIVSDTREDEGSTGQKQPKDSEGLDSNCVEKADISRTASISAEYFKKKRKEMERLAKKAERERWRRSEQEFSLLPLQETTTPAQSGTPSRPGSAASFRSQASSVESVQSSVAPLTLTSKYDEGTDRELALRLQGQLAKEIEEEDEKKALEIGMALHRQWEAEEQTKPDDRHLGSTMRPHTPDSIDFSPTGNTLSRFQANQYRNPPVVPDTNRSPSPIQPVQTQSRVHKAN